jgi:uncharacterized repeat protein (TIGR03803 family)
MPPTRLSHNMTHRKCSPRLIHIVLLLALAVPASAEWKEKVLYSFQGGTSDGSVPAGGVVFDPEGNLYGVLQDFGPGSCAPIGNQCGAVFQLAPPVHQGDPWTETLIYKFQGKGANDGESPNGGLIIDSQGNLYGVSAYGGTGNCVLLGVSAGCGTVYQLSPPKQKGGAWTETILYSFPTAKQGYLPNGDLVFDGVGNLYGATIFGGGKGTTCDAFYQYCGAVFKLSPPKTKGGKWMEKVLHAFASGADGASPNGGLVLDTKGSVYGTTFGGGNEKGECGSGGCGTAFQLSPPAHKGDAWTEKVLYRFGQSARDGANPAAGVVFGRDGNLYGSALGGGDGGSGTIFELKKPAEKAIPWTETILHRFSGRSDGANPLRIIFDSVGNLYGATENSTTQFAYGNVFRLQPPNGKVRQWTLNVVYTFTVFPDAANPDSGLVFDKAGSLYGTTHYGGTAQACQGGCGTVFEVER